VTKIFGWDPTTMREREDAFADLIDRKVALLTKNAITVFKQNKVITAAGVPAAPVDIGDLGVITSMWKGHVQAELLPALSDIYLESAGVIWQGIDDAFDELTSDPVSDDFAVEYLAKATNRLVGIGDHVWMKIREELLVGFSLGETTQQLATRIDTAGKTGMPRANVIARTEANMAANAGSFQQVLVSGLIGTKEWLDTNDERTRCTHKMAGGQTVDLREWFTLGGPECGTGVSYLLVPGDPTAPPGEIIQCRCSVAFDLEMPDEPLVAADREYVRDTHGRFAETAGDDFKNAISGKGAFAKVPFSTGREYAARNQRDYDKSRQKYIDAAQAWIRVANAKQINDGLRASDGDPSKIADPETRATIATLDEIMASSHVEDDIITERGIGDLGAMFGDVANGDMTGVEYVDHGFVSTTAEPGRVERLATEFQNGGVGSWAQPAKMRILTPRGTPAMAPLERIYEVTLDRGLRYQIVADHGVDEHGVRQLDVRVVR